MSKCANCSRDRGWHIGEELFCPPSSVAAAPRFVAAEPPDDEVLRPGERLMFDEEGEPIGPVARTDGCPRCQKDMGEHFWKDGTVVCEDGAEAHPPVECAHYVYWQAATETYICNRCGVTLVFRPAAQWADRNKMVEDLAILAHDLQDTLGAVTALVEKWRALEAPYVECARRAGLCVPSHANTLGWCADELERVTKGEG